VAPWNAATPADTLAVAAAGCLPDLAELAPDAPPGLVAVIERGLSADPHDRGSAAAFALDLRHACRPEPVRLPADGVPDAELARTGRAPRTELTHQVPGRRVRPAPVVVEPPGRRDRWRARLQETVPRRSSLVRAAVATGALAALLVGGWLGVRWAAGAPGAGAGTVEAAVASDLADRPAGTPEPAGPPAGSSADEDAAADRQERPDSAIAWKAVVTDLYERRAAVFGAASPERLADVYTADSSLRRVDEEHARVLAEAGEVLRGFTPTVVAVTGVGDGTDRVEMDLVDRWPGYDVVPAAAPDGPAVRTVPGRPETTVRMVLVRTGEGWRIESAQRLG
jgi:eukaryotic-like serine/threonine-protein kinase